jgi:hypothetical protein
LVLDVIYDMTAKGLSPKQIKTDLDSDHALIGLVPHVRTIQRIVADWRNLEARRTTEDITPWRIDRAQEIDDSLVIDVLASLVKKTQGRIWELRRIEALWITALRRMRPDFVGAHDRDELPDYWVIYRLAREYEARRAQDLPTIDLDAFLLWAPWREPHRQFVYAISVLEGELQPAPLWLAWEQLQPDCLSFCVFRGNWGGLSVIDFGVLPMNGEKQHEVEVEDWGRLDANEVVDLKGAADRSRYRWRAVEEYYKVSLTGAGQEQRSQSDEYPGG